MPRAQAETEPECMKLSEQHDCSLKSRRLLRGFRNANPDYKAYSPDKMEEFMAKYRAQEMTREKREDMKTKLTPGTLGGDTRNSLGRKGEPKLKFTGEGKLNLRFELQTDRECIMTKSPFPGDARFAAPNAHEERFDLPPLNLEVRS